MRPIRLKAAGATAACRDGTVRLGDLELAVATRPQGSGLRVDVTVRNPGRDEVRLGRIGVELAAGTAVHRVLEHGWQSWSAVRACAPDDVRPQRRQVPMWRRAMYFADPDRAGHEVAGEQFLVTTAGVAGFLHGRHHLGAVHVDPAPPHLLTAWAALDGVPLSAGEERDLDPLWTAEGDPGALYSEYATHWGVEATARSGTPAPAGWCSWYEYRSSVSPADVRANLAAAAGHGLDVVQVDDGYQAAIGDWRTPRPVWTGGTAALARDISGAGVRAGIWTAPFLAGEDSAVARHHPDWVVGRAMHNPTWWGGWAVALDTTNPAVLDHVASTLAALTEEGFDYHKVDFLYAAALPARRHDRARTRAQALRAGLEAVRRGVGERSFVLGCGSPFGPAVGIVDAMRVSPDVAPWWLPRRPLAGLDEAASCGRNAVLTSVLRAPLHRRLWVNDADCLLLRTGRPVHAATVAGTGGFAVVSDDLRGLDAGHWRLLDHVRAVGAETDEPLTLLDPFAPTLTVRSRVWDLAIGLEAPGGWLRRR